ncbi:uncharacterized protein LOC8261130 [Ricinus communis]|uniref:Secreted protein n=1 Tax=Ricinus communis TaxID=3988 RepID=B9RHH7_RICCO|nr:uncharacterized protein LOC8261130 [Ricinus communis]EEF49187.1 conserved hypothetical protein [Ricinus communis]|eukprot:XP_015571020.1 uncharacterized protein LOC8261130 [Ricinus communis]
MVLFSAILSCFVPSSSSRVSDDAEACSGSSMKVSNNEKPRSKSRSSSAPIIVSYFPMNSYMSRL